jgi:hypothetical protein
MMRKAIKRYAVVFGGMAAVFRDIGLLRAVVRALPIVRVSYRKHDFIGQREPAGNRCLARLLTWP